MNARFFLWLIRAGYAIPNGIIRMMRCLLFGRMKDLKNVHSILLVRKGNIGDMVCTVPALHALRSYFPTAIIDGFTSYGATPELSLGKLVQENYFRKVYAYNEYGLAELKKEIRTNRYDLVVELPQNLDTLYTQLRNMLFFRFCGIRKGFGWQVANTFFLRKKQKRLMKFLREPLRLLKIMEDAGIPSSTENYDLLIKPSESLPQEIAVLKRPLVVMATGAKSALKRWPLEYFRQLLDFLLEQQFSIVLIGDEHDRIRNEVLEKEHVYNLCGKLAVKESLAVLRKAVLCISNDSGPMHLAYASGCSLLAVFSAHSYPGKWMPPERANIRTFARYDVNCKEGEDGSCACMRAVKPEEMIEAVAGLMQANLSQKGHEKVNMNKGSSL